MRNLGKTTFGVVVKNFKGTFLGVITGSFGHIYDSSIAEILSLRGVLNWLNSKQ